MSKLVFFVITIFLFTSSVAQIASINSVRKSKVRDMDVILENSEVRGYYVFYQGDKVSGRTREFTIKMFDENLKETKTIVFEDDKNIEILEASYNGTAIMFLLYDSKEKTLEYRSYGNDGKQKSSYSRDLNNRTRALIEDNQNRNNAEGENKSLFDIYQKGFVTTYPVKEGKYFSFEVSFFFTDRKRQWTYEAAEEQDDKVSFASYLGNTDSLLLFEVSKQKSLMNNNPHIWLLALNMFNGKKVFEIQTDAKEGDYKFWPDNVVAVPNSGEFFVMGSFYDNDAKITKDQSKGVAAWKISSRGQVTSKIYNSWKEDIGKFVKVDSKGRVENLGNIFFHKIFQTSDGNFYAVGEGYKKTVSAKGVIGSVLGKMTTSPAPGVTASADFSSSIMKIVTTDLMLLKFNNDFQIMDATIYDKYNNSIEFAPGAGGQSPHALALMVKSFNGFDYDYTQLNAEKSTFTIAYKDFERSKEFRGVTFNTINQVNNKLTTGKIKLTTDAYYVRTMPARPGSVVIAEFFRKKKELKLHLEQVN